MSFPTATMQEFDQNLRVAQRLWMGNRLNTLARCVYVTGAVLVLAFAIGCGDQARQVNDAPVIESTRVDDTELRQFLADLHHKTVAEPHVPSHRGRLAMAYDANGFTQAAIETYAQTAELADHDMRWPYLQALALSQQGAIEDAITLLNRALALDSAYLPNYLAKGYWLMDLGRYPEACETFSSVPETAMSASYRLPLDIGLIQCHLELGELGEARRLVALLQDAKLPPYGKRVRERVMRASGATDGGVSNGDATSVETDQLSWSDPVAGEVVEYTYGLSGESILAEKLINGGRAEDALQLVLSLQSRHPNEAHLVELRSASLVELGRRAEAIAVLRDGIQQFEGERLLHFNLGSLLVEDGRERQALQEFDRALALDAKFIAAYDAKAAVLIRQNDGDAARATLEASLAHRPPNAKTHYLLGVLYGQVGDWIQSVEHLTRAIALQPDDANAHASLALSLSEAGRYEDGLSALQRARALDATSAQVARVTAALIESGVLETF